MLDMSALLLPEILAILPSHVSPHLSIRDLACLACSSSALKAAVAVVNLAVLSRAAQSRLGCCHPALQQSGQAIFAALQRQSVAHQNLAASKDTQRVLPYTSCSPHSSFSCSPDLELVAATACKRDRHYTLQVAHCLTSRATHICEEIRGIVELRWWNDSCHLTVLTDTYIHVLTHTHTAQGRQGACEMQMQASHVFPAIIMRPDSKLPQYLSQSGRQLLLLRRTQYSPASLKNTLSGELVDLAGITSYQVGNWSWAHDGSYIAVQKVSIMPGCKARSNIGCSASSQARYLLPAKAACTLKEGPATSCFVLQKLDIGHSVLVYETSSGQAVRVVGPEAQSMCSADACSWSPDNMQVAIALLQHFTGPAGIFLLKLGSAQNVLFSRLAIAHSQVTWLEQCQSSHESHIRTVWSASGSCLAVDGVLSILLLDGSTGQQLQSVDLGSRIYCKRWRMPSQFSLSSTGSRLAIETDNGIEVVDTATSQFMTVVAQNRFRAVSDLHWSTGDTYLLWSTDCYAYAHMERLPLMNTATVPYPTCCLPLPLGAVRRHSSFFVFSFVSDPRPGICA